MTKSILLAILAKSENLSNLLKKEKHSHSHELAVEGCRKLA
jgi:hypothetical protein